MFWETKSIVEGRRIWLGAKCCACLNEKISLELCKNKRKERKSFTVFLQIDIKFLKKDFFKYIQLSLFNMFLWF